MIERNRQSRLALEPQDCLLVPGELLSQDFDCHVAADRGLVGSVDGAHPSRPDLRVDPKLLEQDRAQQRIGNLVVGHQEAPIVRAVLCLA